MSVQEVTRSERDLKIIEDYRADLLSGRVFSLHEMSARSAFGYQPPINRDAWAQCMIALAKMARQSDSLAQVANAIIGRVNLYGTRSQAEAAVYGAAAEAVSKVYTDVIGLAGPEPGRRSDRQRAFNIHEVVAIAYWLELATRPFASTAPGVGWCLSAIADEIKFDVARVTV